MKMRVLTAVDRDGNPTGEISYWLYCPGCEDTHRITNAWDWDGNLETPTFSPSILTKSSSQVRCHSFVRAGVWEFLGDCDHELAGQRVPMVDLPHWLVQ